MFSKSIKNNKSKKYSLEPMKSSDDCKISKASNEIMLYRFYDGKKIEFPFSQ